MFDDSHSTHTILQRMAMHRPRDYIIKPFLFYLAILGVYAIAYTSWVGSENVIEDFHLFVPVVLITATPFMIAALIVITKLDRIHMDLAELALTDVLTKLPNRRSFTLQVDNIRRRGTVGFLLILDADHFKRVNDTYGHAVGDLCLQAIAVRLREMKRPSDVYGRIGGEEFGAFLPYATAAELRAIGQGLCKGIFVDIPDLDQPLRLTMSVGATETRENEAVEDALKRADEALYIAKSSGRARMITWAKGMIKDFA